MHNKSGNFSTRQQMSGIFKQNQNLSVIPEQQQQHQHNSSNTLQQYSSSFGKPSTKDQLAKFATVFGARCIAQKQANGYQSD